MQSVTPDCFLLLPANSLVGPSHKIYIRISLCTAGGLTSSSTLLVTSNGSLRCSSFNFSRLTRLNFRYSIKTRKTVCIVCKVWPHSNRSLSLLRCYLAQVYYLWPRGPRSFSDFYLGSIRKDTAPNHTRPSSHFFFFF